MKWVIVLASLPFIKFPVIHSLYVLVSWEEFTFFEYMHALNIMCVEVRVACLRSG